MSKAKQETETLEATVQTFSQEMETALTERANAPKVDKAKLREQKLKAIKFLEIPNKKSSELVGVEFDIVDAVRKRFNDEINVAFIIVTKDGEKFSCSKPLNVYTENYLDYFESFDGEEKVDALTDYTFVQLTEGGQAGNKPVVLRKL